MKTIEILSKGRQVQFTTKSVTIDGTEYPYSHITELRHSEAKAVYGFKCDGEVVMLPYEAKDAKILKAIFSQVQQMHRKPAPKAPAKAGQAQAAPAQETPVEEAPAAEAPAEETPAAPAEDTAAAETPETEAAETPVEEPAEEAPEAETVEAEAEAPAETAEAPAAPAA